jgi:hypothetical protein
MVIVVVPPRFERLLHVLQVQEPVQRETLASQRATARQARRSDTRYPSRAQCTSGRRAADLTIVF